MYLRGVGQNIIILRSDEPSPEDVHADAALSASHN